jgi:hypothetical protein
VTATACWSEADQARCRCGSPLTQVTKQCPRRHGFPLLRGGYVPRRLLTVEELEQRSLPVCAADEIEAACARGGQPRQGRRRIGGERWGSQHEQLRLPVGDSDLAGESILEAKESDAAAFLEEGRGQHLQRILPERAALTDDHVQEYALQAATAKASDSRSANWSGETRQPEALPLDKLAAIDDDAIADWFEDDVLQDQAHREKDEIVQLVRALSRGDAG